jgi:hypothetical protein
MRSCSPSLCQVFVIVHRVKNTNISHKVTYPETVAAITSVSSKACPNKIRQFRNCIESIGTTNLLSQIRPWSAVSWTSPSIALLWPLSSSPFKLQSQTVSAFCLEPLIYQFVITLPIEPVTFWVLMATSSLVAIASFEIANQSRSCCKL